MSSDQLDLLVQDLPQELYNVIFKLVLNPALPRCCEADISRHYRPPVQLQVNRATREAFATTCYRKSLFVLDEKIAKKWLDVLSERDFGTRTRIKPPKIGRGDVPTSPEGYPTPGSRRFADLMMTNSEGLPLGRSNRVRIMNAYHPNRAQVTL